MILATRARRRCGGTGAVVVDGCRWCESLKLGCWIKLRRVNIRKFRERLSTELKNLPLKLTRHGKVVAVVKKEENGHREAEDTGPIREQD